jgi:capsular polysaccharide transport system permease protein
MANSKRKSWSITTSVWKALFLREAVSRLSSTRTAWLWILVEPLAHVIFLMVVFGFVLHRIVAGVDGAMFVMTGLLGFFVARNTASRCMEAVNANSALFSYRQVLPVDTVLVRAFLEAFLTFLSALLLLGGAAMFDFDVIPHDPLLVLFAMLGLWLCGLGLGLVLSVAAELVPELGKVVRIMFTPLYFISGVMVPAMTMTKPYRDWLFLNPFLHGLEMLREGYFGQYHAAPEADLSYLYGVSTLLVFFGLALHVRFAKRMVAQ